jgi:RNA polymerase sigma-70 factor (ECF subfamily)
MTGEASTSPTLLHRLRTHPTDDVAWRHFIDRYGTQIYSWCRNWGLQDADAQDVTQTVLLKLGRRMRTFEYDRQQSFRAWLHTVTRHALHDFHAAQKALPPTAYSQDFLEKLVQLESREDLLVRLERVFDLELLESAKLRVRLRVLSHTWQAYQMTAERRIPALAVAQQLGLPLSTVYAAKANVVKMLQKEIASLEEDRS